MLESSTCVRQGWCPVSKIRPPHAFVQEYSLYYELHGTGPERIVLIAGLNATFLSWVDQVQQFMRDPKYSVLVFDNCGVGRSDSPWGPYTTRTMAEDIMFLLDHLSWTAPKSLHIVGNSFGGMIAQELAWLILDRIASLTLVVTSAGGWPWSNLPSLKGAYGLCGITLTTNPLEKMKCTIRVCFPQKWLDDKAEDDKGGRTNRELLTQQWCETAAVSPPQSLAAQMSHLAAAITHKVSSRRLRIISKTVPKTLIITGDEDQVIEPRKSFQLKDFMPEAEFVQWKATGHGLYAQHNHRFNRLLQRVFAEGSLLSGREETFCPAVNG